MQRHVCRLCARGQHHARLVRWRQRDLIGHHRRTVVNRFVEKVRILINPVDPAFWTMSPDQLPGRDHFGQGWGTYTESCIQSYTHSVDTDEYGRMSVDIECPPSAE